ncbi:MAG: urease accessory UreF family protein [Rhodocyclaceae bacterium]|jgi:urease accessory protein
MPTPSLALTRLLHLASPALPVGAFSYSQGLEWAVECGDVKDAAQARAWIGDALRFVIVRCEGPAVVQSMRAWRAHDLAAVRALNLRFIATRETSELRAETVQMGYSLARLLRDLDEVPAAVREALADLGELAFPTAWAGAAAAWELDEREAITAYLWAWLENQTMAAIKLVPLGQTAGQKMLLSLAADLPALTEDALARAHGEWENFAPLQTLACGLHETQYTRLFRS